ncbi:MAG TPA: hypothetical protein DEB39_00345 [Planctomycetaceae bacterium]|nr:hypothetical protein [Planctomycetaceae bacterium]
MKEGAVEKCTSLFLAGIVRSCIPRPITFWNVTATGTDSTRPGSIWGMSFARSRAVAQAAGWKRYCLKKWKKRSMIVGLRPIGRRRE